MATEVIKLIPANRSLYNYSRPQTTARSYIHTPLTNFHIQSSPFQAGKHKKCMYMLTHLCMTTAHLITPIMHTGLPYEVKRVDLVNKWEAESICYSVANCTLCDQPLSLSLSCLPYAKTTRENSTHTHFILGRLVQIAAEMQLICRAVSTLIHAAWVTNVHFCNSLFTYPIDKQKTLLLMHSLKLDRCMDLQLSRDIDRIALLRAHKHASI